MRRPRPASDDRSPHPHAWEADSLSPTEREQLARLRALDDTPPADWRFVEQLGAELLARRRLVAIQPAPRALPLPRFGLWAVRSAAAALCLLLIGGYFVGNAARHRDDPAPRLVMPAAAPSSTTSVAAIAPASLPLLIEHPPAGPLVVLLASATLDAGAEVSSAVLSGNGAGLVLVTSGALTIQSGDGHAVTRHGAATPPETATAERLELAPGDGFSFPPRGSAIFANDGESPVWFIYAVMSPRGVAPLAMPAIASQSLAEAALPPSSGSLTLTLSALLVDDGAGLPPGLDVHLAGVALAESATTVAAASLPANWRNPGPGPAIAYVVAVQPAAVGGSPTPAPPTPTATPRATHGKTRQGTSTATKPANSPSTAGNGASSASDSGSGADQPSGQNGQSGGQDSSGQGDGQTSTGPIGGQGDEGNASKPNGNASGNTGQTNGASGNASSQDGHSDDNSSADKDHAENGSLGGQGNDATDD